MAQGILYVVSTPIGNLKDITFRAVETLRNADLIAAEDTRRTGKLRKEYQIDTRMLSFYSHNRAKRLPEIVDRLISGSSVALVTDSGTPGISDPGSLLITECIDQNIKVTAVPGPTALVTALVLSGKPTARFVFQGFVSRKSGKRKKQIRALLEMERTVVLYESPHRILSFLQDFKEVADGRRLSVSRELTKKFEETERGTAQELIEHFTRNRPRGEFVVVF